LCSSASFGRTAAAAPTTSTFHDGEKVGRLYRINGAGCELWRWTHFWYTRGPNGGVADTLEDAKAAFRKAWDGKTR
jgi:hypothetical protein